METGQLDSVRLDADTKIRLSTLKRRTGIEHWNTLCRWAFCLSIADESPLRDIRERQVGAIEMSWKTFAGSEDEIYRALLVQRSQTDLGATDRDSLAKTVRQHIARGTARLVGKRGLKSTRDLVALAPSNESAASV
jgi:DNA sulfur modification protein DndE